MLLINKFFNPVGGEEVYLNEMASILEEKGHEVSVFSTRHPDNWPTLYERYFVDRSEIDVEFSGMNLWGKIKLFPRLIYNTRAHRKLKKLLKDVRPDVAHIFNIGYYLTPSIIYALKQEGIPIIQSVNNYKIVCPNQRLYILERSQLCFKCRDKKFYHATLERCIKNSLLGSMLGSIENYIYTFMGTYLRHIDYYVVANNFMKNLLCDYGIDKKKIIKVLNPIKVDDYKPCYEGDDYYVYFGRLSEEKGIFTLIDAAKKVKKAKLIIIGSGNIEGKLKDYISSNDIMNIEIVGPKWNEQMKAIVRKAKFVVVPSEWYENSPYVIYQAFSLGKPVIGSDVNGGISELIQNGKNGLLFPSANSTILAEKINYLLDRDELVKEMSANAREFAENKFDIENIYKKFISVYQTAKEKKCHNNI